MALHFEIYHVSRGDPSYVLLGLLKKGILYAQGGIPESAVEGEAYSGVPDF